MKPHDNPVLLHLEVIQKNCSVKNKRDIADAAKTLVRRLEFVTTSSPLLQSQLETCPLISRHVDSVTIYGKDESSQMTTQTLNAEIYVHVYRLQHDEGGLDIIQAEDNSDLPAAERWSLPSHSFHGLWENLVYDSDIKKNALNFVTTSLLFADKGVNPNVLDLNKVVLFHGPPGTGKTSLCKALAQKLAIRFNHRYERAQLVEINSHSLFSKWFSESGKLVLKLFDKIREYVEDSDCLVCVLIDEIESLAQARKSALSGSEPSEAIRVVNAVLTQLDKIKRYSNVLILTTSNMTGAIDLAFVDRTDLKYYIGLPSQGAIYKIYYSCIVELIRTGIISESGGLPIYETLRSKICDENNESDGNGIKLFDLAKFSEGLSGRTLRKIPFLAHALYGKNDTTNLNTFFVAMKLAIAKNLADNEVFCKNIQNVKI